MSDLVVTQCNLTWLQMTAVTVHMLCTDLSGHLHQLGLWNYNRNLFHICQRQPMLESYIDGNGSSRILGKKMFFCSEVCWLCLAT